MAAPRTTTRKSTTTRVRPPRRSRAVADQLGRPPASPAEADAQLGDAPSTPPPEPPLADDAAPRGPGRPRGSRSALAPRIADALTGLALPVALVNQADALAIVEHAEPIAYALDRLAKENPAVKRVLERLLTSSAWGGVIVAVLPLVIAIAGNHGMLPGKGPQPPSGPDPVGAADAAGSRGAPAASPPPSTIVTDANGAGPHAPVIGGADSLP